MSGSAILDDCGVCSEGVTTHVANSDIDCNDVCFGQNLLDNCSVCDDNTTNDCEQDCTGEWGGVAIENECGCVGGLSGFATDYCYGCTDMNANNYDPEATTDNGDCIYPSIVGTWSLTADIFCDGWGGPWETIMDPDGGVYTDFGEGQGLQRLGSWYVESISDNLGDASSSNNTCGYWGWVSVNFYFSRGGMNYYITGLSNNTANGVVGPNWYYGYFSMTRIN